MMNKEVTFIKKYLVKLSHLFAKLFYPILYKRILERSSKDFRIASINDTIKELIDSDKSLSRFGDGEIEWIFQENYNSFEKNSKLLSEKLLKVLNSSNKQLMIGLPDVFTGNDGFTKKSSRYYKIFLSEYGNKFLNLLNIKKHYYNTGISRMYIDYNNKNLFPKRINAIKKIWKNKDILLIEGKGTRFGVGNKLLNNAKSIYRIECPSTNAFESYNKILNYSLKYLHNSDQTYLVLIALGPTATILSYDLCENNYQAIDIGHLDLEYEWFLHNDDRKVNLSNRYVNEVNNGNNILSNVTNNKYRNEIIHIINND